MFESGNFWLKMKWDSFSDLQVDVSQFVSSRHNMGMSLTRKVWNEIKKCGQVRAESSGFDFLWRHFQVIGLEFDMPS